MNNDNIFRLLFIDDFPKDVIEKFNKGLINITEAIVMAKFESEEARNQILSELRAFDRMYRMSCADMIGKEFKKKAKNIVMKRARQSREAGMKPEEFILIKEAVDELNQQLIITAFHIEHIGTLKSEGEPCPAYKKVIDKEYETMIKRWKKSAIDKGLDSERTRFELGVELYFEKEYINEEQN